MRNYIFPFAFLLLTTISCSSQIDVNKVINDPDSNKKILIGKVDDEGLKNYSVFTDAEMYYNIYKVDKGITEKIVPISDDINIKVVFGTWCGDSQINVPAFQKIVNESGFDKSKVEYIAVDRKKTGGKLDISKLKVNYVPTFIFYRNGNEIGRIIEYPRGKNIEEDWINIVSKK
jgi:thiol-disulfide isomerase/thioredoxin